MIRCILLIVSLEILLALVESKDGSSNLIVELTDEKWDQIQKGQWLIGFFDRDSAESQKLEEDWNTFALKCHDSNINVGRVFAPQNPGLYVRFLVTDFPKVFYIKNGVAHEVQKVNRQTMIDLIREKKWDKLKSVGFLINPFSVQMSLLSNLFIHAVNLYNFENTIVQKFVSAPSATDFAFGLTFIVVGTLLGLLLTCAFGVLQIFLSDSKEPEEKHIDAKMKYEDKDEITEKDDDDSSSEKSANIRKRK